MQGCRVLGFAVLGITLAIGNAASAQGFPTKPIRIIVPASANLGIAIGSLALIEEELASKRLVRLFPEIVVEAAGFHMLYRAPQRRDAALDLFVAWVKERGEEAGFRNWSDAMIARMTV